MWVSSMEKIKLIEPTIEYEKDIWDFRQEILDSDDKDKLGAPSNYTITVKDVCLYSGAGFITVLLGDIMTMPGLSKKPALENIDITSDENIIGIF